VSADHKRVGIFAEAGENMDAFYVTAGNKKYFMLKDTDGAVLAPAANGWRGSLNADLDKDQQYTWWAKFPAPPADVKKITLMTAMAPPFEDIPVTDQ
jgi:hypothetical protein